VIYKVKHAPTGSVRALKYYKFTVPAEKFKAIRLLQIESTVLTELYHNQIIRTYETGFHQDHLYLVTDFINGDSLEKKLYHTTNLSDEKTLKIALNIAQSLAYAHDLGIIHTDLIPSNVFIREGFNDAVVTDFRRRNLLANPEILNLIKNDEELDSNSEYEVGERIYEEGEDTPPSIFYGKITKFNDNWVFTLKE
jgi:serine/threonine protein kinase